MQGFIQDFSLGGGKRCVALPYRGVWGAPPGKKISFRTSETAFQAYFDKKLVLISKLHVYQAGESVVSGGICIILINFLSI
jgi:hypothetical protein